MTKSNDCFDRYKPYKEWLKKQTEIKKEIPKNDPVLTELRLIRNYLEKLTLLQETKNYD